MALKPCSHCGNHISDKAKKCPKCGVEVSEKDFSESKVADKGNKTTLELYDFNKKPKTRSHRWIMIAIPLIIIGLIFGGILYFTLYYRN